MIALAITLSMAFLWVVFFVLYLIAEEDFVVAAIGATVAMIMVSLTAASLYGLALLWERALS